MRQDGDEACIFNRIYVTEPENIIACEEHGIGSWQTLCAMGYMSSMIEKHECESALRSAENAAESICLRAVCAE